MNSKKENTESSNQIELEQHGLKKKSITNFSHELRTPLTSIIGFAEMLLENPLLNEELRLEYIRIIRDEGKRLERLINNIMSQSFQIANKE